MNKHDITAEAAKSIPPVSVVTAQVMGFSLNDWVLIATLVWIVLQMAYLISKWWRGK